MAFMTDSMDDMMPSAVSFDSFTPSSSSPTMLKVNLREVSAGGRPNAGSPAALPSAPQFGGQEQRQGFVDVPCTSDAHSAPHPFYICHESVAPLQWEEAFTISAQVPGVAASAIDVAVYDNAVTITVAGEQRRSVFVSQPRRGNRTRSGDRGPCPCQRHGCD